MDYKTHKTLTDNPPIRTYNTRTKNKITFTIESEYDLEIFNTLNDEITQNRLENMPNLKITKILK